MKQSKHNALVMVSAVVVLAVLAARVTVAAAAGEEWQPVQPRQEISQQDIRDQRVPPRYDPVLLALGRSVYADLQRARQAALDRQATNLRVSIREARETVRRLLGPVEAEPLHEQLEIIRNDLRDRSKQLDSELWVPVEAEIDDTLVYVPESVRTQAHEAIRKAREAASQDDREGVAQQLDVVTSSMEYSLGIFPPGRVKANLESAAASASLSPPDWAAALEAVQSAMATFHWYTQLPVHALLDAYNDVVDAYVLAAGPVMHDGQKWRIDRYLLRAQRDFERLPDNEALVSATQRLIEARQPQRQEIRALLGHVQERIHTEQAQSRDRYWKSIGTETPE
jgi:hypothetical protein